MIEIIKFRHEDIEFTAKSGEIRRKVFVEEQGVDPELEYDEHESSCTFYLLNYNGNPVGTGRWRFTENGIKLERFSILPEFRNRGLGAELIKAVLIDVLPENRKIYLHSQLRAVNLYERFGFVKEGELFIEAGIEHYQMVYKPGIR